MFRWKMSRQEMFRQKMIRWKMFSRRLTVIFFSGGNVPMVFQVKGKEIARKNIENAVQST